MDKEFIDIDKKLDGQISLLLKLFDAISDILILKNTDGIYLDCNLACVKFMGYSKEEIIGKTNFNLFSKDIADKLQEIENNVIETKKTYCTEIWAFDSNRKHILFEILKSPLFDDNGDLVGILCINRDITDRKFLEKSLTESRNQLKALLDNLPFMAWLKNTESRLLAVNEPYAKMCSIPINEIIGKTDLDLFPIDDAKEYIKDDIDVVNSRCKKFVEESISGPSGITWHETYKTPVFDENNNVIGTVGIARDITERKNAEQELLLKDKLLFVVAEAINELVKNLNFEEAIVNAFGIIGSVINVDRIILLKNRLGENQNDLYTDFAQEWCSDQRYSIINDIRMQNTPSFTCSDAVNTFMLEKPLIGNTKDMEPEFRQILETYSVLSTMLFPICIGNVSWGQVGFDDCNSERNWSEAEKAVLSLFASAIASVIERNQKREQERQAANREALLRKIITTIRSSLDLDETITAICDEVGRLFNVQRASIMQFPEKNNPSCFITRREYKFISHVKGLKSVEDNNTEYMNQMLKFWAENVVFPGNVVTVDNISTADVPIFLKRAYDIIGVKSIIGVPIGDENDKWGGIFLSEYTYHRKWSQEDIDLLRTITSQIYVAIKHAELYSKLEKNEKYTRIILDNIKDGIITINTDCTIESCNPDIKEMFGYSTAEIIGSRLDLLLPHTCSNICRNCNEGKCFLQDIIKYGTNVKGRKKDGTEFPVEMDFEKIDFDDKSVILMVLRDITQRKQFEDEILSRDSLLIAVSEAINELVVTQDINEAIINAFEMIGNIINVDRITLFENRFDKEKLFASYKYAWVSNSIYSQINDLTLQNMPIDSFPDIANSLIQKKIMVGNTENMEPEFRKILKLHNVRSIMLFPIHIEENFWGFIGFDDCKSERTWNEAEKAILMTFAASIAGALERNQKREQEKNNERRLRTILDNVQDGIVTISDNCMIESCNPAIANIFGYAFSEIIGFPLDLLLPHSCSCEDKKCSSEKCTLQETFAYEADAKGRRKDGSTFPVEVDIKKIDFDNKSIVLMVIRDITQRKEFDKMKNEFVSTVSHELRTPLTSIKGSLGLVTSGIFGAFPEKANELLNIANSNCSRLTNLINDILDLEKIKAGKMEFKYEELEINSILEHSIVLNQAYADQFGMKIKMIKFTDEAFISADKNRLLQVISNLFSNAVKFSKLGDEVTIMSENINGKIKVSFIDKGIGIPEDSKHKIFSSFSQVDSSDSRSKGGSGLGLSICKLIIEKMGGEIAFDSVAGEGSTFFFIMPEITKSSITESAEK